MITIDGKKYEAADLTYGNICKIERMGVPMAEMDKQQLSALAAYAALCMKCDFDTACEAIDKHVTDGGDLAVLATEFTEAFARSGFMKRREKTEAAVTKMPQK